MPWAKTAADAILRGREYTDENEDEGSFLDTLKMVLLAGGAAAVGAGALWAGYSAHPGAKSFRGWVTDYGGRALEAVNLDSKDPREKTQTKPPEEDPAQFLSTVVGGASGGAAGYATTPTQKLDMSPAQEARLNDLKGELQRAEARLDAANRGLNGAMTPEAAKKAYQRSAAQLGEFMSGNFGPGRFENRSRSGSLSWLGDNPKSWVRAVENKLVNPDLTVRSENGRQVFSQGGGSAKSDLFSLPQRGGGKDVDRFLDQFDTLRNDALAAREAYVSAKSDYDPLVSARDRLATKVEELRGQHSAASQRRAGHVRSSARATGRTLAGAVLGGLTGYALPRVGETVSGFKDDVAHGIFR